MDDQESPGPDWGYEETLVRTFSVLPGELRPLVPFGEEEALVCRTCFAPVDPIKGWMEVDSAPEADLDSQITAYCDWKCLAIHAVSVARMDLELIEDEGGVRGIVSAHDGVWICEPDALTVRLAAPLEEGQYR